jgi:hypothetical protein
MWSRRLLVWGIASAVAAAALALVLLWLVLVAYERAHPREPLHVSAMVAFAVPGLLIYPLCWYAIVFRHRSYGVRDTWKLLAISYGACCLFDCAIIYVAQAAAVSGDVIAKGPVAWALLLLALLLAAFGLAVFATIIAGLLAVPFIATAAPIAFLHRALVLRAMRRSNPVG